MQGIKLEQVAGLIFQLLINHPWSSMAALINMKPVIVCCISLCGSTVVPSTIGLSRLVIQCIVYIVWSLLCVRVVCYVDSASFS